MPPDDADDTPIYEVRMTEPAEAEVDAAYLGRMQFGERVAKRWHDGLNHALESLSRFPYRFPIAPESDFLGGGVRQMIVGKGAGAYHVLYRIIESQDDEPGIVRVVRVRPASRRFLGQEPDE